MPFAGWQLLRNRVLGNILGFAAGTSAAAAFTPAFRDLTAELERAFGDNRRHSAADLAELVVRGARTEGEAAHEAADIGYNADRFHELFLLAGNPPGPADLADLWNRGVITEHDFEHGIRTGRIRTEWIEPLKAIRHRLFTPAEAAALAARGLVPRDEAAGEARHAGVSGARFEALERMAAHPPATGEVLSLLNRGHLDEGRARRALLDAGVRAEYIDELLELRHYLLPPTDVIRLAVHEVYTPRLRQKYRLDEELPPELVRHGARLGMSATDSADLWAGHWQPPSAQQGFDLFHRGELTERDVADLLRVHDYVPYWRDKLIALSFRIPGRIDLRRLFRLGVIGRAELVRGWRKLGYSPEDAERLAVAAQREKMGAERDLTKAELVGLYEAAAMEGAALTAALEELGYDRHEAEQIIALADARRASTRRDAVAAVVKSRFLDRELDEPAARARLRAAGFSDADASWRLDLWGFELAASPHHITEAQMRAAWAKGIVDESRYRAHLERLGVPADEAEVLVTLYRPGQA